MRYYSGGVEKVPPEAAVLDRRVVVDVDLQIIIFFAGFASRFLIQLVL